MSCEHLWKPLGQTIKEISMRKSDQLGEYDTVKVGEIVVASIYCEKCGEIRKKEF
jgi:hypothetical protein